MKYSLSFVFLLIFYGCQQNAPAPPAPPTPAPPFCGIGSFDINGVTKNTNQYIPYADTCSEAMVMMQNGFQTGITLHLHNDFNDFQLLINAILDTNGFVIGQTYNASSVLFAQYPAIMCQYHDMTSGNLIHYNNHDQSGLIYNGSLVITNLDTVNNLISGAYQFNGYNSTFPSISITNGVFTDVRARFSYP